MEPGPTPDTTKRRREPNDADPDFVVTEGNDQTDQTDQDVDTAGTEADEAAVGTALDKGNERKERRRSP